MFAINVVVERTAVVQDLVTGRAAEALHLLDVAEAKVGAEVVAHGRCVFDADKNTTRMYTK